MRNLVIGDVHAVPEELDDCEALVDLVENAAAEHKVEQVTWLGDQHNAHDALSTRVLAFWRRTFDRLRAYHQVAIVGNHDQAGPRQQFPHAMMAYQGMRNLDIIDRPQRIVPGVCGMPYFHDPAEFLAAATKLKAENDDCDDLFCHQTFKGADGGFYAKDECPALAVPFKVIFSGHIHKPQVIDGKLVYVGAPRWRTKDDAGHDRFLLVLDHAVGRRPKVVAKVPTDTAVSRLYVFQDRPGAPAPLQEIPEDRRALARVRVDVHGPAAHVKERELVLRAAGCRTRAVVERERRAAVTEAEGVDKAFGRYLEAFQPPNGTPATTLRGMLEERLAR